MRKGTIIVVSALLVLGGLVATLFVTEHYCQPQTYVNRLTKGMTYSQVSAAIPGRLVVADLHTIADSKFEFGRVSMERMGVHATRMMVLEDTLWPITQATVCFLYFDDQDRLVDWFTSSS